jgi:predicted nucleic acid-binding Zn ribbon protein
MMSERKCLECGDPLHGRADQKFCGDQCRNAFNNKQLGETSNIIRRINRILRKNQAVLSGMKTNGKMTVRRSELMKKEFNFSYVTHLDTTHQGRIVYYCYDQGYTPVGGDKVKLIRPILPCGSHIHHGIQR